MTEFRSPVLPDPRSYVVISPCRNEANYMRRTLDSMVAQSEVPALWVIIDDGSTDETPAILAATTGSGWCRSPTAATARWAPA